MLLFVFKRMLAMIPTLFGITFLTFLIITCAPGDPVAMQMGGAGSGEGGGDAQATKGDAIRAKRKLLGMMEPEHAVRTWLVERREPERRSDGGYVAPRSLEREPSSGEFASWARSLAVSADERRAWAGGFDGAVTAFDLESGETDPSFAAERFTRTTADGRTEGLSIWALALSPDGRMLAASDALGRIRILSATDGRTIAEIPGVGRTSRDLEFLPSGDALVAACDDGKIRIHDAAKGDVRRELAGHVLYVGALAVTKDGGTLFSVGYDRKVRRWDLATGKAAEIGEVSAAGACLALSADGAWLAAGGEDRGATVFDVASGKTPAPIAARIDVAHAGAVSALALTPDRSHLLTAAKDGGVRVWRLPDGVQIAQAPDGTNGQVHAVVVARDGTRFWTASESDRPTPVWRRYLTWLGKLVRLDFDRSFIDDEKVIDKIAESLPVTLGLNLLSIVIIYLVSVPIGVIAAVRRGRAFDRVTSIVVFLLWSMPSFWFATLLIQWFSSRSHWDLFPSVGLQSANAAELSFLTLLGDRAAHLVLPLIVLTYGGFAGLTQYMRTSVLENIQQDYIRTARAKGLSERIVIFKHALRNSLVTLVTLVGTMLPGMIGGSVIIERIFNIRGMGYIGFTAITERDYPVIMAVTTMGAVLTLIGMLVSDILYAAVDPRISHQ